MILSELLSYSSISSWVFLEGIFPECLHQKLSLSLYCFYPLLPTLLPPLHNIRIFETHSCFSMPLKLTFHVLNNPDTPSIHHNTFICVGCMCPLCLACRVQASHPYMSRWVSPQQWPLSVWYPWSIPSFLALYVLTMTPIILMPFLRSTLLCYVPILLNIAQR